MKNCYKDFCTGCGLCHDQQNVSFFTDSAGYDVPTSLSKEQAAFCDIVCPMGKNGIGHDHETSSLWGNYRAMYKGFSCDEDIRFRASSGGVTTTLAVYLLEKKLVDGVIHIQADPDVPYRTKVVCSYTPEEVIQRCGSRYCQSSPLYDISKLIKPNEKYAFIGKPCDVRALRNLINQRGVFADSIPYLFSFFCAGTPTDTANKKLLNELGCPEERCTELHYRGNGWPGLTYAIDDTGKKSCMEYEKSWMAILGRSIRKSCKFCFDGIGEAADVSCGDYWNLGKDNKPLFEETKGQNVVFGWTQRGAELLIQAKNDGKIELIVDCNMEKTLELCQPNHKGKRSTTRAKILALKVFGKQHPLYDDKVLKSYSKYSSSMMRFNTFKGTIKRIIQKSI